MSADAKAELQSNADFQKFKKEVKACGEDDYVAMAGAMLRSEQPQNTHIGTPGNNLATMAKHAHLTHIYLSETDQSQPFPARHY